METKPCYCIDWSVEGLRLHYIESGCEYARRVLHLMFGPRRMVIRAAKIVVKAAMYGIGCTEGEVRAKIEQQKESPTP